MTISTLVVDNGLGRAAVHFHTNNEALRQAQGERRGRGADPILAFPSRLGKGQGRLPIGTWGVA